MTNNNPQETHKESHPSPATPQEKPMPTTETTLNQETQQQAEESVTLSKQEWKRVTEEAVEFKDKYLRLLAETENARKRMEKERLDLIRYAIQNVVLDLLPPLDHLEKALAADEHMSDELRHWALGFKMILTQLQDALADHGVHPFSAVGASFDPHLHEAVEATETDDAPEGTILQEFVRGYKLGERILRPARVRVAKAPQSQESSQEQGNRPGESAETPGLSGEKS